MNWYCCSLFIFFGISFRILELNGEHNNNSIQKILSHRRYVIPCATVRNIIVEFQWKIFSKPICVLRIFRHMLLLLQIYIIPYVCYRSKSDDVKSGSLPAYWPSCTCFMVRFRSDRNHALSTDASNVHRCCAYRAWCPSPSTERQRWVWMLAHGDVSRR